MDDLMSIIFNQRWGNHLVKFSHSKFLKLSLLASNYVYELEKLNSSPQPRNKQYTYFWKTSNFQQSSG